MAAYTGTKSVVSNVCAQDHRKDEKSIKSHDNQHDNNAQQITKGKETTTHPSAGRLIDGRWDGQTLNIQLLGHGLTIISYLEMGDGLVEEGEEGGGKAGGEKAD